MDKRTLRKWMRDCPGITDPEDVMRLHRFYEMLVSTEGHEETLRRIGEALEPAREG